MASARFGVRARRTPPSRSDGWRRSSPSSSSARACSRVTTRSCRRPPRPCCRSSAGAILGGGAAYYALQYSTFAILVLAANTAFADFPRLSSILARDGYMPRQFAARGDRLAFSNGIIALAVVAALLIWLFRGETSALIPLYAIGVFVCFTLSQAGMVMHWLQAREPGWQRRAALNGIGAVATALVSIVQVVTKFTHGAWIVVLIIPLIIAVLRRIHRHYEFFAREVAYTGQAPLMFLHHTVIVPVNGITKPAAGALVYATTICEDVRAVYVEVDPKTAEDLRRRWTDWDIGVELTIIPSPYRSIMRPLVDYVNGLDRARRSGSRHGGRAGDRAEELARPPPPQQDVALHSHGVSVPAERRRDRGAVSRRACGAAARPGESRRVA